MALAQSLPRLPERLAIEKLAHGSGFRDAFAALPYFLQMMSVEAYQSLLWNGTLRAMVSRANQGSEEDLIRADDEFGEMLFLDSSSIPRAWLELSIPMPAPDVSPSEPWGAHMLAELRARHLTLDDLRIPGLRRPFFGAALRPAFVHAESFALSGEQRDDLSRDPHARKRHVSFELPRGAYATVVLRALGQ